MDQAGLNLFSRVKLNSGFQMPVLGLGVYLIQDGGPCTAAVRKALDLGYRHFDSAKLYGNEADLGRAVRESGLPRREIFVTTKLWNTDHGFKEAKAAFAASLKRLGLDYVDLYLIHWPVEGLRLKSWKGLVDVYKEGLSHSIGVSNFTIRHLKELLASTDVVPAVNQVEFSPFLFQKELMEFCQGKGIVLQAYSPLTHGARLKDPRLKKVAGKYGKSPAQVLIRWNLQHSVVPLPKSSRPERMKENAEVFDFTLSAEDMAFLDHMNENLHTDWDPADVS
jgi:diketogulonate reductase-like aldo/keto reductase